MNTASTNNLYPAATAFRDGRLRQAQLKMLTMLKTIDALCQKHDIAYWLDAGTLLGAVRHQGFIPWDDDMDISMPRADFEKFLSIAPTELPEHLWLQTIHSDPGYFNLATPLKIRDRHSHYVENHEQGNEPYVQGIFIDVFVYDRMPENKRLRNHYKFKAKKISRLLYAKYCTVPAGHYARLYRYLGMLIPKTLLESALRKLIDKTRNSTSPYLGRGYQCVGKNCVHQDDIFPLKRICFEDGFFNIPQNPAEMLWQQFGAFDTLPPAEQRIMRHCKQLIPHVEKTASR